MKNSKFHIIHAKQIGCLLLALILSSLGSSAVFSQNIYATYHIVFSPYSPSELKFINLPNVPFTWHVYLKKNKVYSYREPKYLKKYPDGIIKYKPVDYQVNGQQILSAAKKQILETVDFDTLISRTFFHNPPSTLNGKQKDCDGRRESFKLIRPFQPWIFLNETKTIQGIECQHAKLYNKANELIWDLWLAPGIPIPGFTNGLYDLPGLLVEGHHLPGASNYSLLSYTTELNIPDETFWPECFHGNFSLIGIAKPYTTKMTQ